MSADMQSRYETLRAEYETYQAAGLKLDLTRGKPAAEQLDLANELDGILDGFYILQDGTDVRNYGGILGIPEARALGGDILGVPAANVMVGGNSSLTLMYQYVTFMLPKWRQTPDTPVKFICQVPGYDRHFTICEHFDIEMIPVPMLEDGPDMATIQELVAGDAAIKGIWCVPKYSNPTGHTYSPEVVKQFAALPKTAGDNFAIFWDNAYAVHHIYGKLDSLTDLMSEADSAGTADNVVMFGSTSKITFAGAGISFLGASSTNLAAFEGHLSSQVIGFDKVNQLRHARFLKDAEGVAEHMNKHQAIIEPKFRMVEDKLSAALGGKDIAAWTTPTGGYFVSLDTKPGLASRVISLAAEAGVKLTPAGATFPHGHDPEDRNIRIAPTFPSMAELEPAMDVLVNCIELATLEQALAT